MPGLLFCLCHPFTLCVRLCHGPATVVTYYCRVSSLCSMVRKTSTYLGTQQALPSPQAVSPIVYSR